VFERERDLGDLEREQEIQREKNRENEREKPCMRER
jgi:hypothetical protein